ncbi:MAG TPA: sigma 54-interacting transcriptional regulator [Myxococcota bacterium]|nr:sigma 54-interacting transcriptional regulator [Myxococcota bacterium]
MSTGCQMGEKNTDGSLLQTTSLSPNELAQIRALTNKTSGAKVSLLITYRDGVRTVPLVEGQTIVVGRSQPADVILRDNSLSRQHACVELIEGEVWVEDLQSTNGTWLNGEKLERGRVAAADDLAFGAVTASIHLQASSRERRLGLDGHDRFADELQAEVGRARVFGRTATLMMFRCTDKNQHNPGRWFPGIREQLRPFDKMALYSSDTVEILVPESPESQALDLAKRIVEEAKNLVCGLGVLPTHAASADELIEVTRTALQKTSARNPVELAGALVRPEPLGESPEATRDLVVLSSAMQKVFEMIPRLANSAIPVLIIGDTGSGKEVVARAIHVSGKRRDKPMRCINCGGIPPNLVESTLFGHEKGSFTGANQKAEGVFEFANGGTVLLDEIGELPAAAQAALLRVLETKRFTRVGANKEIEVDVRILTATNKDLEAMANQGAFRKDLLYRLNAMTLQIPPLNERPEEIVPLASHFIKLANQANACNIGGFDEQARELLLRYSWPGNVRELRNAIERAVVIAQGEKITIEDLPEKVREIELPVGQSESEDSGNNSLPGEGEINLKLEMERHEATLILEALRAHGWDRKETARALGLPVRTLAHKMKTHGIKKVAYQKN